MNYQTVMDSPIGRILIKSDGQAITTIHFVRDRGGPSHIEAESVGADSSLSLLMAAKSQLEEYFAGKRRDFELPLKLHGTDFQKQVWNQLLKIPYGVCTTYGEIAARLDNPLACRAVGLANGRNPIAIIVPCHRVIGASGALTGYAYGVERKKFLLDLESTNRNANAVAQSALFSA